MKTPTRILFEKGLQDWFLCSLGFRHGLVDEDSQKYTISCPHCDWKIESMDPKSAAKLEEEHLEECECKYYWPIP